MNVTIEPNGNDYTKSRVIIENVDVPLLEKQREVLVKYSLHIDSFQDEITGLLNLLDSITDVWYFATHRDEDEKN